MANYSSLLAAVNAAITANGTGAITGPVLNTVLQQMIVSLGQGGYIFKGRAIPTTDPGSPDQNVFYIATTPGTYTNFSSIVVAAGECAILKGSGTSWSKEATGIDLVSVSQNTDTGHTDINIGSDSYPVASVDEVSQLGFNIYGKAGTINLGALPTRNGTYNKTYAKWEDTLYVYGFYSKIIEVNSGEIYEIISPSGVMYYGVLAESPVDGQDIVLAAGESWHEEATKGAVLIPDGGHYLVISYNSNTSELPLLNYANPALNLEKINEENNGQFLQLGVFYYRNAFDAAIDIDDCVNGIVSFTFGPEVSTTGLPPFDYGDSTFMVTIRKDNNSLNDYDMQFIINRNNIASRVYYHNEWFDWNISWGSTTIECGTGKPYTTLRSAVSAALLNKGTKVIIYPGTYDLAQEFSTEISNHSGSGIELGNDIHLLFMPGSYVECLLEPNDPWAHQNFEPFHVREVNGNFTIENINIHCRNTRYCFHDDLDGRNVQYSHRYINCTMKQEDTYNTPLYFACIGGGLGKNAYIEIIGGMYQSSVINYIPPFESVDDMQTPITWHGGNNQYTDSKIIIHNVFLKDKGYIRIGNYGPSTMLTPVFVSGCRMYKPVWLMNETGDPAQVTNFEIISFNNEIINP